VALELVGSKSFGHNSTSAQSCSLTDLTGGLAAAPAENDVVFIAYTHANVTTAARTLAQCTPSGYTNLHPTVQLQNDSNATSFAASAKKMTASPDTTVDIPAASAATSNVHVTIEVWRDVDFANITTTAATTAKAANTGLPNPPSITTPAAPAGCVVLGLFGAAVANATATAIANAGATPYTSGFKTGSYNTGTGSRAHSGIGAKTGLAISTAFDAALSGGATANTGSWAAVSVMVRPNLTPITADASPSLGTFLSTAAAVALIQGVGSGVLNAFGATATVGVRASAVASPALDAFTSSATVTVSDAVIHADAAPQLDGFTVTSAVKAVARAAASPSLATFMSSAAAKALVEGIGSGALNAFGTTATVSVRASASAAVALDVFTAAATASVPARLSAAPALDSFLSEAAARALIEGLGEGVLNAFQSSGAITVRAVAGVIVVLDQFTASATAAIKASLAADCELDPFISEAQAKALVEGFGSGDLNPFTVDGLITTRIAAAAAPAMAPFTVSATLGSGPSTITAWMEQDLGEFSVTAAGRVRIKASAAPVISEFRLSASLSPPLVIQDAFFIQPNKRAKLIVPLHREKVLRPTVIRRIIFAEVSVMSITNKQWVSKWAGETDYRGVDWKTELVSGETIVDYDFVPEEGSGVIVVDKFQNVLKTIALLSGGTAGATVKVMASVSTSNGRFLDLEIEFPIT